MHLPNDIEDVPGNNAEQPSNSKYLTVGRAETLSAGVGAMAIRVCVWVDVPIE